MFRVRRPIFSQKGGCLLYFRLRHRGKRRVLFRFRAVPRNGNRRVIQAVCGLRAHPIAIEFPKIVVFPTRSAGGYHLSQRIAGGKRAASVSQIAGKAADIFSSVYIARGKTVFNLAGIGVADKTARLISVGSHFRRAVTILNHAGRRCVSAHKAADFLSLCGHARIANLAAFHITLCQAAFGRVLSGKAACVRHRSHARRRDRAVFHAATLRRAFVIAHQAAQAVIVHLNLAVFHQTIRNRALVMPYQRARALCVGFVGILNVGLVQRQVFHRAVHPAKHPGIPAGRLNS